MKENNRIFKSRVIRTLTMLEQECAEVILAATKIRKFGPYNYNPNDPNKTTNDDLLLRELGDLSCVLSMAADALQLDLTELPKYINEKRERLKKYPEVNW